MNLQLFNILLEVDQTMKCLLVNPFDLHVVEQFNIGLLYCQHFLLSTNMCIIYQHTSPPLYLRGKTIHVSGEYDTVNLRYKMLTLSLSGNKSICHNILFIKSVFKTL